MDQPDENIFNQVDNMPDEVVSQKRGTSRIKPSVGVIDRWDDSLITLQQGTRGLSRPDRIIGSE